MYLGRVSYGTYLWHWPVIVIATQRFHPEPGRTVRADVPARDRARVAELPGPRAARCASRALLDRHRTAVIAVGLAASLDRRRSCSMPAIMRDDGARGASSAAASATTANGVDTRVRCRRDLDLDGDRDAKYGRPDCYRQPRRRSASSSGTGPAGPADRRQPRGSRSIPAFVGDRAQVRAHARDRDVAELPVGAGHRRGAVGAPPNLRASVCRAHQEDWYNRVVPQFDPDIVVLAHRTLDDPITPSPMRLARRQPRQLATRPTSRTRRARRSTARSTGCARTGRKIVIIEPLPVAPGAGRSVHVPLEGEVPRRLPLRRRRAKPTMLEQYFRPHRRRHASIYSIDLDRLVCPYLPICDPIVGGIVVKKDRAAHHRRLLGAMATPVEPLLADDGITVPNAMSAAAASTLDRPAGDAASRDAGRLTVSPAPRRLARGRGLSRGRVPRRARPGSGRVHRRRRVLRAVGLPRHPAAAARPRGDGARSASGASTRGGCGGSCPPRSSRSSSPRSSTRRSRRRLEVLDARRRVPRRVPLRRQLVLHPPVDRLLRAPTSTRNPVVHFWSLAVEEQFYLALAAAAQRRCSSSRRRAGDRQWKVVRHRRSSRGCRCSSLGAALHLVDDEPQPRVLRHRHPRVRAARRRAARDHAAASCAARPTRRGDAASRAVALGRAARARRDVGVHLGADPARRRRDDRRACALIVALESVEDGLGRAHAVDAERGVSRPRVVRHVPVALAGDRDRDAALPPDARSRCSR